MFGLLSVLLAAGLGVGIIPGRKGYLTWLSLWGVGFEVLWLTLALLNRTILAGVSGDVVYVVGGLLFIGLFGWQWKQWRGPLKAWREVFVLLVLLLTLGAAGLIWQSNGLQDNLSLQWHGFFNGDTATFVALSQRSFLTEGLVAANPFAANGYLEYPTVLHGAVADFWMQFGIGFEWFYYLSIMTYVQIFLTVPLFFWLFDQFWPESRDDREMWLGVPGRWLPYAIQAGIVVWVMALSWDSFVYPQGHFFLTGPFLLLSSLCFGWLQATGRRRWVELGLLSVFVLALALSNAVTGTAALVVWLSVLFWVVFDRGSPVAVRGWSLAALAALSIIFVWALPGDAAFGWPQFSYTAAFEMGRLALPIALLFLGLFTYSGRYSVVSVGVAGLVVLALLNFSFSQRNIVIENAVRFLYHALLIGFPVLLPVVIQAWYGMRRRLWFESMPVPARWAGLALSAALLFILVLPGLASVASAHDNLQLKNRQVVTLSERDLLWWISDHTDPRAVFLTALDEPFSIPMYTGRAMVRADYWLSPQDAVFENARAGLLGDAGALRALEDVVDYVVIDRRQQIDSPDGFGPREVVFENREWLVVRL